ncbi:type IV pilin [Halorubrum sp. AJ67]|uniref:type IV pilin n=1 Tax=Halorubrum sp. AJ67 TaxID=1173487 RepID=UPI0009AE6153|nr:type IV pilin N-terminal domain-containing protein [Halorubrum sp. AJ67]
MNQQDRAVTPVVSTILMVAIVVILAATVSVFALGFVENINEPAPQVAQTTGEFVIGPNDQAVKVNHIGGNYVEVKNIEIIVRASGSGVNKKERLINLPSTGHSISSANLKQDNGLIAKGYGDAGDDDPNQVIIEDYPTDNNRWEAGETIRFEINSGENGADFREGESPHADELEVVIVHTESNAIISEHVFRP